MKSLNHHPSSHLIESPFSYLVKINLNGHSQTHIWNSEESFFIGHPHKWELIKEDSKILIKEIESNKILEKLSDKDRDSSIKLKDAEYGFTYHLEIKNAQSFAPVYQIHDTQPGASELQVYHSRGWWVVDAEMIRDTPFYARTSSGLKVFSLKKINRSGYIQYEFHTYCEGVFSENRLHEKTGLIKKANRTYSLEELAQLKFNYQDDFWTFSLVKATPVVPAPLFPWSNFPWGPLRPELATPENIIFQKSLKTALVSFGVIVLLAFIFSFFQTKEEEPPVATILLPQTKVVKKMMTAAPKGDPKRKDTSMGTQGNQKNAGRKGSVAQVKTPTVKKEQPMAAPMKKPMQKSSQKVANVSPQKAQKSVTKSKSNSSSQKVAQAPKPKKQAGPSQSLQKAAQSLMQGGATALLAQSRFGEGSDIRSEGQNAARGQGGGSSLSRGGDIGTSGAQTLSAGSGQVSGFGGGGGAASGNGDGGPGSSGAGYGRGSHARVSGQGRSFVSLDESASEVDEGLTKDQVGRVIHKHMSEIRYCYENSIIRNPNVGGRLSVNFNINPSGRVSSTNVQQSTVGDSRLNTCITGRLKQWQFPKPRGGVNVAVMYPFIFKTL